MDDEQIVELYWQRNETAIQETERKYSRYLTAISRRILASPEDVKEAVNDTYLRAWNAIPPHRPALLSTFLGKIIRQRSIDFLRKHTSQKRGGEEYILSLQELEDCVSGGPEPEEAYDYQELALAISDYLRRQPEENRNIFLLRYFFLDPIREIAFAKGMTQGKVKSILFRMRNGLKEHLDKEGF